MSTNTPSSGVKIYWSVSDLMIISRRDHRHPIFYQRKDSGSFQILWELTPENSFEPRVIKIKDKVFVNSDRDPPVLGRVKKSSRLGEFRSFLPNQFFILGTSDLEDK